MRTPEVPGPWRAGNLATPDQIKEVGDLLITPELIIADAPLIYSLPATSDYPYRTLSLISNVSDCAPIQGLRLLSLMNATIQEQTHLLLEEAVAHDEQFYARRTIFEIGLEVEDRPEGRFPADDLYLKLAHYDTTLLRELEKKVGDRSLTLKFVREDGQDFNALKEAEAALSASRTAFLRRSLMLQSRAAYGDVEYDEAEMLLGALRARGEALPGLS